MIEAIEDGLADAEPAAHAAATPKVEPSQRHQGPPSVRPLAQSSRGATDPTSAPQGQGHGRAVTQAAELRLKRHNELARARRRKAAERERQRAAKELLAREVAGYREATRAAGEPATAGAELTESRPIPDGVNLPQPPKRVPTRIGASAGSSAPKPPGNQPAAKPVDGAAAGPRSDGTNGVPVLTKAVLRTKSPVDNERRKLRKAALADLRARHRLRVLRRCFSGWRNLSQLHSQTVRRFRDKANFRMVMVTWAVWKATHRRAGEVRDAAASRRALLKEQRQTEAAADYHNATVLARTFLAWQRWARKRRILRAEAEVEAVKQNKMATLLEAVRRYGPTRRSIAPPSPK